MKIPRSLVWLSHLVSACFLGLGILYPLTSALLRSGMGLNSKPYVAALLEPTILRVVGLTTQQAAMSLLFSILIGLPLGLWIRGSRRGQALLAIPFGVPTLVVATAWVGVLGSSGWLAQFGLQVDRPYALSTVILAHVFLNAPWIALRVSQARGTVSRKLLEAAETLGADRWARFRFVVWPEIRGSLVSSSCQVFALCVMSFSLVLILGGGPPVETLETAIYARIRYRGVDIQGALACAIWQSALTLLPWWLGRRIDRLRSRDATWYPRSRAPWSLALAAKLGVAAFFLVPYLAVLFSAFRTIVLIEPADWFDVFDAFKVSARLAIAVSVSCFVISVFAVISCRHSGRLRSWFEGFWIFPSGLSTLVLSLAVWLTFERWVDFFSGSLPWMTLVQTLIFVPVVFRILSDTAVGVQTRLLDAATTLGATAWQAFRWVEWPRWRMPVITAFSVVFVASLGEVAAVSLFVNESARPLPYLMTRWMAQYRFAEAEVVAAGLLILASVLMVFLTWVQTRERWVR